MTDTFACPIGWCDEFPFDSADDLADHLAGHPLAPGVLASQPGHQVVAPAPAAEPTPVRSFSPGGTRTTVGRRPAKPASDKQVAFIRSLADRKGATLPDVELSSRDASALIEDLLVRPDADNRAATVTAPVPEGFHVLDDTVYKVQVSKTGNRYAKILDRSGDSPAWEYAGARPLRDLSADTVATLDQAKAFGIETGTCMCCGRTLTNPDSIENGIGPICAGKYF